MVSRTWQAIRRSGAPPNTRARKAPSHEGVCPCTPWSVHLSRGSLAGCTSLIDNRKSCKGKAQSLPALGTFHFSTAAPPADAAEGRLVVRNGRKQEERAFP